MVFKLQLLLRQHSARQHYKNYKDLKWKIGHLSRLVSPKDTKITKQGLQEGSVDIVVGIRNI